jgi:hypothetical protein
MQRIEINLITGEKKVVDLSAAEIAALPVPVLPTYQELRIAAYPPITDYLDGVVKGDAVQVQAYVDACLAVKTRYPKL